MASIFFTIGAGFYYPVSNEVIFYSTVDLLLSCTVVYLVFLRFQSVRVSFVDDFSYKWEIFLININSLLLL